MPKVITFLLALLLAMPAPGDECYPTVSDCPADPTITPANTWTVGVGYGDYNSIGDALDIAAEGDTILVYPGEYTETVEVQEDKITLIGMGQLDTVVLSNTTGVILDINDQAHFAAYNMTFKLGAGAAITDHAVSITTGDAEFHNCHLETQSTAIIANAVQPSGLYIDGAGTVKIFGGTSYMLNSSSQALGKQALFRNAGGTLEFYNAHNAVAACTGLHSTCDVVYTTGAGIVRAWHSRFQTSQSGAAVAGVYSFFFDGATGASSRFQGNEIVTLSTTGTAAGIYHTGAVTVQSHGDFIGSLSANSTEFAYITAAGTTINARYARSESTNVWHTGAGTFNCYGESGAGGPPGCP